MNGFDILAAHAGQTPGKAALITSDGGIVTYQRLNGRANRCAAAFRGLGVREGDRCLHIHHNCVEGFELVHALRKLRVVISPLNHRLRAGEIAYLIQDSGAAAVVAGPEFVEVVDAGRGQVADGVDRRWIVLGDDAPPGWLSYERLLAEAEDDEPEAPPGLIGPTMVYTAGTTGRPKGAYRAGGVDPTVLLRWVQWFGLRPDDVHLMAGPGYHSAPAAFAVLQQVLGATCVVMPAFDPEQALRLIERERVTTTFMAPILVKRILDLPEEVRRTHDVSSLRALLVAAAPFPADLKRRAVEQFGDHVYEFYGATETGIVTWIGPGDLLRKPHSCGRPAEGVEVRLLDAEGDDVPTGEPGELWSRSSGMFGEYLNRSEETRRAFRDGFFSAGDIAYADEEGFIHICDRSVDMIISGGTNIYPAEIEEVLLGHPAVDDCAVIGVPDPEWGEAVKAVVALRPGASATSAELTSWCGERLAPFKRPRSVDFVDSLPRDPAGKLLKRLVREPYWQGSGRRV